MKSRSRLACGASVLALSILVLMMATLLGWLMAPLWGWLFGRPPPWFGPFLWVAAPITAILFFYVYWVKLYTVCRSHHGE